MKHIKPKNLIKSKLFFLLFIIPLFCLCQVDNIKMYAGAYMHEGANNMGIRVLAYNQPICNCGKWSARFNPYVAIEWNRKESFIINAGPMFTAFRMKVKDTEVSASVLPYYFKYSFEQKGYITPIGIFIQLTENPVSLFVISDWYKNGSTVQVMLTLNLFSKKENQELVKT